MPENRHAPNAALHKPSRATHHRAPSPGDPNRRHRPDRALVAGEQYIAVLSGWGVDAQRMQNGIDTLMGQPTPVPQGGTVLVYKLEK